MRTKFKDELLDKQLEKDGYIVIPNWLTPGQIEDMKEVYADCNKHYQFDENILNTLLTPDKELKKKISEKLMEQMRPSIDKYFIDYMPFFSYFLIKPHSTYWVNFHRDSSVFIEDRFEYLTIWLTLDDVDVNNGCIFILPESQKLFTYPVPISEKWPYLHLSDTLKKYAVDVPMKAGDLLIFHEKTLHGSYPNLSGSPRHVVSSALMHPDTQMLFYAYNTDSNIVDAFEVDASFYFEEDFRTPAGKYPLNKSFVYNPPKILPKEIESYYNNTPVKQNVFSSLLHWLGLKN
jgi:hypothetical protein